MNIKKILGKYAQKKQDSGGLGALLIILCCFWLEARSFISISYIIWFLLI